MITRFASCFRHSVISVLSCHSPIRQASLAHPTTPETHGFASASLTPKMRHLFQLWLSATATLLLLLAATAIASAITFNGSSVSNAEAGVVSSGPVVSEADRIGSVGLINVDDGTVTPPNPTCVADGTITYACNQRKPANHCLPVLRTTAAIGIYTVDGQTCSGAILGKNKDAVYFLTAAECLEKVPSLSKSRLLMNVGGQRFHYQFDKLYRMDRRLGYAILTISPSGTNLYDKHGFLQLRKQGPKQGERLYIPRYLRDDGWLLGMGTTESIITAQPLQQIERCTVLVPASRFSYTLPLMEDYYLGSPVISATDGTIVGLHMCTNCRNGPYNSAVGSDYVAEDLIANGSLRNFLAFPFGSSDYV